jgi:DNA-binding NarL/FixJ family response regulator
VQRAGSPFFHEITDRQRAEQAARDNRRCGRNLKYHDDEVWKQVPMIVLTTSRQREDIAAAYRLGVNSCLVKLVGFTAFADVVEAIKEYWLLMNEPPFPDRDGW